MKTLLTKLAIRTIYLGQKVTFKAESKGTVRFLVGSHGSQGFFRVRKNLSRGLARQMGDSFTQYHIGKVTIGLGSESKRSLWNFAYTAK